MHQVSTILAQLLGFTIAVAIFGSATLIGLNRNSTSAAMIWVLGMAIVTMAAVV